MSPHTPLRPHVESLETKKVMSAGASTQPVVAAGLASRPGLSSHAQTSDLASTRAQKIDLSGQVNGTYTSRKGASDTASRYDVNASGTITPAGSVVVTGSFRTGGSTHDEHLAGTLTIVGPQGNLYLKLVERGHGAQNTSTGQTGAINPGGPMIGGSTGTTNSITAGPIILLNSFRFEISRGTGTYAQERSTGTVTIETTPGLSVPTGPGIYASALASQAGVGRTIITFTPA
jgi:hypothetical protein